MKGNSNHYPHLWREEEQYKENVYNALDETLANNADAVASAQRDVDSGAYEDQDAFVLFNKLAKAIDIENRTKREYATILIKPYFSHVAIRDVDSKLLQMMLSDSANLDRVINIGTDVMIVPFKQSKDAPMLTALFHQYQVRKATKFKVDVQSEYRNEILTGEYQVDLIRDVDILNRELRSVVQIAPQLKEDIDQIDEMLTQRLEENRSDAKLRNIIATLQQKQFDIISTDIDTNFVVQGCAGSGKTQCLIHRLFFLRDSLGNRGWEKVLLITPTQLFRNYSMELMRRYHLTDVNNCSLSDFYCSILTEFDSRFKNRQYQFELTEEYLPDDYLRQVYAQDQIDKIDIEIKRAIAEHVREGCKLLEIDYQEDKTSAVHIESIVQQLDDRIVIFDERARKFSQNTEYNEHLEELDKLDKQVKLLMKSQEKLEDIKEQLDHQNEKYDKLIFEIDNAEEEFKSWQQYEKKDVNNIIKAYVESLKVINSAQDPDYNIRNSYRNSLFAVIDSMLPIGKKNQKNKEHSIFLKDLCHLAHEDLNKFTSEKTDKVWRYRHTEKCKTNAAQLQSVKNNIQTMLDAIDTHSNWIKEYTLQSDNIENQRQTHRAALEKTKYYLSRIESSIFEQEVWNALEPLKTKYNIETLRVEKLDTGRQKQTRILYKSDLLFYAKIYAQLHSNENLPSYDLICIDEGQDLHSADYKLLRTLYPNAILNIFGDIAQALHENCGIKNWEIETGIRTIFRMNSNYRNTPAIVAFCNEKFGEAMTSYGDIKEEHKPTICCIEKPLRLYVGTSENIVIVKNRDAFIDMCNKAGLNETAFDYLDTKADKEIDGKIHCYSVFAAKGLEFRNVVVYSNGMNTNQKIVACTRAMEHLYYCE